MAIPRETAQLTIKKLASANVEERLNTMTGINNILLEKAYTTGEARRYFKYGGANDNATEGLRIITRQDDVYDDFLFEKASVKYFVHPDPDKERFGRKPVAVAVGPDASTRLGTFAGERYIISFDRYATDTLYKDVNELYPYSYDIVGFFETWLLKVLMDTESKMFFTLQNHLLSIGRSYLARKNIMVATKDTFSIVSFSLLKDLHKSKEVPFSRLLSYFHLLNEKERTDAALVENLAYEGVKGNTKLDDTFYQMTPLVLHNKKYVYYSFDKANASLEDETNQFFIDLSKIPAGSIDEIRSAGTTAACEYVKDRMEAMGYLYTDLGNAGADAKYGHANFRFVKWLDADNYTPRPPIYKMDKFNTNYEVANILGKKMIRSIVLTPRAYFGHMDLFEEDARSYLDKDKSMLAFYTEEQLIMTAKNARAVTALDVWE